MRRLTLLALSVGIVLNFAALLYARASGPLGGQTSSTSNEVRVTSETPGGDLGAKINAAVADCGRRRCDIWVDQPGTISTSPDIPQGDSLHLAPGTYTLTTTWNIRHSGTIYDLNGAVINYTQNSAGDFAIKVGKSSAGTVNTNGQTVTWVSGTNFADIDPLDVLIINGVHYNIASVQSPTRLTLTASAGNQSGASYLGLMMSNLPLGYSPTVVLRNLTLRYTGSAPAESGGILFEGVVKPYVENVRVTKFLNGTGWQLNGTLDGTFLGIQAASNGTQLGLSELAPFSGSNLNTFISPFLCNSTTASGHAISIDKSSTMNTFIGADVEGNRSTVAVLLDGTTAQERFENCDFERNGDGTAASRDVENSGLLNTFANCSFSSAPANFPASGVVSEAASKYTDIRNCIWVGAYTTSYSFAGGATGRVENNRPMGAHREPAATP